jgi:RimJ/RimL family protein N-acetyltransferase
MDPAHHHKTATRLLLQDDRIGLRPLAVSDADAHLAGCDDVIDERLGGGEPSSRSQVKEWLERNSRAWSSGGDVIDLGIEDLSSGLLCGSVGIQRGLDYLSPGQVNLAYALYPRWRGRGYATRAVRLAMQAAQERRPVAEFVIRAAPDNPESMAVAERAGFERSGHTNDAHGDLIWLTRQP